MNDQGVKSTVFDINGNMIRSGRWARGRKGMVSTGKEEVSKIGIEIMKKGGSAIDAAVAVGFAIGVCEPNASGLGGGGFILIRDGLSKENVFVDFREVAPQKISSSLFTVGSDGKVLNQENAIGGKSVCTPGEVAGLIYALEKYGTMTLADVLEPSIKLAEEGFYVSPLLAGDMKKYVEYLKRYEMSRKTFLKDGKPYKVGERFTNPNLAKSLRHIAQGGRDAFYKGHIANEIVETVKLYGGVLDKEDLENYRVEVRSPVIGNYRGYTIISSPPPSSGGTHIIQILNMLEHYDIKSMEVNSAKYLHMFSEVFKIAYTDRAKHMGDTKYVNVPVKGLSSKEYSKELTKIIDEFHSKEYECKDPWLYEHEDTTHYSIGDEKGNLVSVTKTINHFFGSCVVAGDTGILLNDQVADFSTEDDNPNSIESGKKPLSSMSPTIILKDNRPFAILGTPGGSRIISTLVQVISKLIDHEMDIQDAIDSPRIIDDTRNEISYEGRISTRVAMKLRLMGHKVKKIGDWDRRLGAVQGIKYEMNGELTGAADPRRDGKAYGY
ncbi:MAG: gamma-glutamyltransferase [Anaeromicrobium sp.]|jgi:gamma-glutamyltranspeptidase/glutathione hydrolase|uniref:gamma-glutamyltransferase n=1 Tax=Anaeromicrobium sp. TaxID=1929132 RepID=UPI0025E1560F|nr:gamma-glutamyltransferase [Anaeromicrobium sp.]MCT4593993.1 gamma-glutamyltransferase [Anaeromicrobium sp.]